MSRAELIAAMAAQAREGLLQSHRACSNQAASDAPSQCSRC